MTRRRLPVRHNLGTVISFEVARTFKRKWFWITTLIVPVAFSLVIAMAVSAGTTSADQSTAQKNAEFTFVYTDASGYVNPDIVAAFGGSETDDPGASIADVQNGLIDAYIAYPADPSSDLTEIYGADLGIFENGKYSAVARQIIVLSVRTAIGDETLANLTQGVFPMMTTTYQDDGHLSGGMNAVIPPLIFLVIFYLIIILLANQMTNSLLEEKENRVTEMILTTLEPTTLVIGKVVSLFIAGIVQIVIFAVPIAIGYVFFRDTLQLPNIDLSSLIFTAEPMITGALLLLGGFILFTTTLVVISAIMPTVRDAGQIMAPFMIMLFLPFYVVMLVVSDPGAPLVQFFTYFPYTAPVTAMLRNAFGSLSLWETAIVLIELCGLGAFMLHLAVRLFQYGSIEYSKKISLKMAFARQNADNA